MGQHDLSLGFPKHTMWTAAKSTLAGFQPGGSYVYLPEHKQGGTAVGLKAHAGLLPCLSGEEGLQLWMEPWGSQPFPSNPLLSRRSRCGTRVPFSVLRSGLASPGSSLEVRPAGSSFPHPDAICCSQVSEMDSEAETKHMQRCFPGAELHTQNVQASSGLPTQNNKPRASGIEAGGLSMLKFTFRAPVAHGVQGSLISIASF